MRIHPAFLYTPLSFPNGQHHHQRHIHVALDPAQSYDWTARADTIGFDVPERTILIAHDSEQSVSDIARKCVHEDVQCRGTLRVAATTDISRDEVGRANEVHARDYIPFIDYFCLKKCFQTEDKYILNICRIKNNPQLYRLIHFTLFVVPLSAFTTIRSISARISFKFTFSVLTSSNLRWAFASSMNDSKRASCSSSG